MFDVKNCKALLIKQTKKLNIISKKILDDKSTNSQFITTFLQQFNAICFLFTILQANSDIVNANQSKIKHQKINRQAC